MLLARQHDDQLLAIAAVDHRHHGDAILIEPLQTEVMRNFELGLAGHDALALFQAVLDLRDDGEHLGPHVLAACRRGDDRSLRGDVLGRGEDRIFRPVVGGDLAGLPRDREKHILVADALALGDRTLGEHAAAQIAQRARSSFEGSIRSPTTPAISYAFFAASSQARACSGLAE